MMSLWSTLLFCPPTQLNLMLLGPDLSCCLLAQQYTSLPEISASSIKPSNGSYAPFFLSSTLRLRSSFSCLMQLFQRKTEGIESAFLLPFFFFKGSVSKKYFKKFILFIQIICLIMDYFYEKKNRSEITSALNIRKTGYISFLSQFLITTFNIIHMFKLNNNFHHECW